MTMKYHKIRGIDKSVCTCEQKIAYNVAFANYDLFANMYNAQVVQIHKTDIAFEFVEFCMRQIKRNESIVQKYNIDAIQCALNAGSENYLSANYHILLSYEEIGKMFPAYYL